MLIYEYNRSALSKYVYHQLDRNLSFAQHMHNSYEFICCLDGKIEILLENKSYLMEKGDCVLIQPMRIHGYNTHDYSKTYLCVFSQSFIEDFHEKYKNLQPKQLLFKVSDYELLIETLNGTENEYLQKSCFYKILFAYSQNEFCAYKVKQLSLSHQIIEFIGEHFTENISLKTLGKELGYSYTYLSAAIKNSMGTSFVELLNGYRLNYAKKLLNETDMNVTEIIYKCGFNSIRCFNRNFRLQCNTTPKSFRLANR
ncbi:MAG: AraC family transcriptional regulator [Clostridia bacterium]|nr:AraC family transcriptional regulator [Clostridia bacterium]